MGREGGAGRERLSRRNLKRTMAAAGVRLTGAATAPRPGGTASSHTLWCDRDKVGAAPGVLGAVPREQEIL